jgi:hypothetical protein
VSIDEEIAVTRYSGFVLAALLIATPSFALVLPPEGIVLTQIHVQFEWASVGGATSYDLEVVIDDGSPDPFLLGTLVVNTAVASSTPRTVVTSGLAFDEIYAWRVRGVDGAPMAWGATHRFEVDAIPAHMPGFTIAMSGGPLQPGLTLFAIRRRSGTFPTNLLVALENDGTLVWFYSTTERVADVRLLETGRLLMTDGARGSERIINGQLAWISPDDSDLNVHHEVFPMPSGDVMALTRVYQDVTIGNVTKSWEGDRIVVFDRTNNDIIWNWDSFDHLSTLDYDTTVYASAPSGGVFDWTHANSAIYDAGDDAVYISLRHLSRILKIDYATGNPIYQMGFTMASGDVDFGDNLFSFQHALQLLANGNLMVFDNGNRRDHTVHTNATGTTKAIELSFSGGDPPTGASINWEWTLPLYSGSGGDADRLANGNTLVASNRETKIFEVNAAGTELWSLAIDTDPSYKLVLYRAERIASLIVDVPGDSDLDGWADMADNCPDHDNASQVDSDGDGFGDVCQLALGPGSGGTGVPSLGTLGIAALCSLLGLAGLRRLRPLCQRE